jgi:transcriptional regulator with XRE-family HTH domain
MERPGQVIERLRLERGLTQVRASALGGLPRATWSAVESCLVARPNPETKLRIARALRVRPSSIWPPRLRPLHLEDVDDPRWEAAVLRLGRRLDREGSLAERQRFGRRLITVLDYADQGSEDPDSDGRWEELWRLANSLLVDPKQTPTTVIAGKLMERDLESFTAPTRLRVAAAKRGHMREAGAA